MMKVIFLDVDGVLNPSSNSIREYKMGNETTSTKVRLDMKCIKNLKRIIDNTDAQIILSSSWRKSGFYSSTIKNLEYQLNINGMIILDFTPILKNMSRIDEINKWLEDKSKVYRVDKYVILDDDNVTNIPTHNFIRCNNNIGITNDIVDIACNMLNG